MRIHIAVYDVEDGLSGERACKMLLASFHAAQYDMLWRALIADSLEFAANRTVVTQNYIRERYGHLVPSDRNAPFFTPVREGEIQIGYDILLGRSPQLLDFINETSGRPDPLAPNALILLQLYRFDASGKKQFSQFYPNNRLVMPGEIEVEVIHRCSSITGMERFLETYPAKDTAIVNLLGNGDGQEDHFPAAQLHKKWVTEQFAQKTDLCCIHCGEPIAGEAGCILEIDNAAEQLKAGYAHLNCTRPIDRMMGRLTGPVFDTYAYLKNFDYAFWAKAKGQRLFGQLKGSGNRSGRIFWNGDIQSVMRGRFCIQANLEHGDCTYVTQRGYVMRGSKAHIESQTNLLNALLNQPAEEPFGFTSISNTFGDYSSLINTLEVGEEFRACLSFQCVPYTSTIRELFDVEGDYYGPLVYLTLDGSIAVMDGAIFMLTNPLELDRYLENWRKKLGYDLGNNYSVVTLKNDAEFDHFVRDAFDSGLYVVVDPWFGNKNDLVRGYLIEPFQAE